MTTSVPSSTFGPNGFIPPSESAILAGVMSDQQAAFGGNLNPALNTPQGQLATSLTAIIGDKNDQFAAMANGVDPSYAAGRMQDAIARIYFLTRNPAVSTTVTATCSGLAGTLIPIGAKVADQAGNLYLCTAPGTIPVGGTIDLTFASVLTGPIACPALHLSKIYQAIPGWDSVSNVAPGVQGNDVETRAAFEYRRLQSVAMNSMGSLGAVLGSVLAVPGVLDAYAIQNTSGISSGAVFIGSISGNVLTVDGLVSGVILAGQMVTGPGVARGTSISSSLTGGGGAGSYLVSGTQTVATATLGSSLGGIAMLPHSILVSAYGGNAQAIAEAIWRKKDPGANYNGNTTMTVVDSRVGYNPPYPSYQVTFEIPTPTPVIVAILMQNNSTIPATAVAQIQAAVVAAFTGADGGQRARIGSAIFASRFYAGIAALGPWASIYSIQVGIDTANQNSVLMSAAQVPTIASTGVSVTFA